MINKLKYQTALFAIIVSFSSFSQTCDCKKFRTGKFEIANQDGTVSHVTRTKTKQTEKNDFVKTVDQIVWIDDCTFKLIPISVKDKEYGIGYDILQFRFIETFEHAYIVHVTMEKKEDFGLDVKVYEKGYLNYDKK